MNYNEDIYLIRYFVVQQTGFGPGRNCCDQVLALPSFIENGIGHKKKTSAAFVDLSAACVAYVWRKGPEEK